ncbi:MAG: ADP-forming succinate--CoA ligase subunit beta [Methanomassiliicoccales archaeon]|nr:ADP-forming succinate--CoA ligase subunit beta [Methanomassiliicoccales archaeon]
MKLLEHQAKELFREYGIPTPCGYLVDNPNDVDDHIGDSVIKAQVLIGGRGKAGGIRFANDAESAREEVRNVLGMDIRGFKVRRVLIEERLHIARELYMGIAIDRSRGLPLLLASKEGGVEIESVKDELIGRWHLVPDDKTDGIVNEITSFLALNGMKEQVARLVESLWRLFWDKDCELVEINPLVVRKEGDMVASDAKIIINDDALFRHPELPIEEEDLTPLERRARDKGIAFVQLDGGIGVIANGAGLTMSTLDTLSLYGGKGGVFLDLGGTDDVAQVVEAFRLMVDASPKVILVNIFGGITKCDTVAKGIVQAKESLHISYPMVARIKGVNETEARRILEENGIFALQDLDRACRKASELEAS